MYGKNSFPVPSFFYISPANSKTPEHAVATTLPAFKGDMKMSFLSPVPVKLAPAAKCMSVDGQQSCIAQTAFLKCT